jgi:hypothetical protein
VRALGRAALALAVAFALPALAVAHEGHAHRLMATVTSFDAAGNRLQVKTADGRTLDLNVDASTRYKKGSAAASAGDLKPGARVVVSYTEKSSVKTATEVLVGGEVAPAKKAARSKKKK